MNVASLELCKELYDLSEWGAVPSDRPLFFWHNDELELSSITFDKTDPHEPECQFTAAYDLGYLLRKLPAIRLETWHSGHVVTKWHKDGIAEKQERLGSYCKAEADNPEDALAKLAIDLFKQGILKKEG